MKIQSYCVVHFNKDLRLLDLKNMLYCIMWQREKERIISVNTELILLIELITYR